MMNYFSKQQGWRQKKCIHFLSSAIPILAVLYIVLPIGKMWMVIGLLLLGFYAIFNLLFGN